MTFHGTYEISEARDAIDAALALFPGSRARGLLLDKSASGALRSRTGHQVRMMALFIALRRERFGNRVAIVAPCDQAATVVRLGCVTATTYNVLSEVTRDYASAIAWLEAAGDPDRPTGAIGGQGRLTPRVNLRLPPARCSKP